MRERVPEEQFVKDLAEFEALAGELRVPYTVPRWEFQVAGSKPLSFHSQSWTRNYVNRTANYLLSVNLNTSAVVWGEGELNSREIDGTIRTTSIVGRMEINVAAVDDDTQGIILGSGTDAESLDDYVLSSLIANGHGAGQLQYYALDNIGTDFQHHAWDADTKKFVFTTWRYFLNDSGGNVTVTETAVVMDRSGQEYMVIRDLLPTLVVVPDHNILLARYIVESAVYP